MAAAARSARPGVGTAAVVHLDPHLQTGPAVLRLRPGRHASRWATADAAARGAAAAGAAGSVASRIWCGGARALGGSPKSSRRG